GERCPLGIVRPDVAGLVGILANPLTASNGAAKWPTRSASRQQLAERVAHNLPPHGTATGLITLLEDPTHEVSRTRSRSSASTAHEPARDAPPPGCRVRHPRPRWRPGRSTRAECGLSAGAEGTALCPAGEAHHPAVHAGRPLAGGYL